MPKYEDHIVCVATFDEDELLATKVILWRDDSRHRSNPRITQFDDGLADAALLFDLTRGQCDAELRPEVTIDDTAVATITYRDGTTSTMSLVAAPCTSMLTGIFTVWETEFQEGEYDTACVPVSALV